MWRFRYHRELFWIGPYRLSTTSDPWSYRGLHVTRGPYQHIYGVWMAIGFGFVLSREITSRVRFFHEFRKM